MVDQSDIRNRLLASLPAHEFIIVEPFLEPLELDRDFVLILPNIPIEHVYCIEKGMVSVVAEKADGRSIEVGVYGRDGVSGTPLLLGSDQTPRHHYMQIGGSGFRMETADFRRVIAQCPALHAVVLKFVPVEARE